MPRGFFDRPRPDGALEGPPRDAILEELCARRSPCLLATPYLSLETRLLAWSGDSLLARAPLSASSAKHVLGQQPLRLRLPWALSMVAGETTFLERIMAEDRPALRLALPPWLAPDERRSTFRVVRVGHCPGTLGSREGHLVRVRLEDLSALGAGVFPLEPLPAGAFLPGRSAQLALDLEEGPSLNLAVRVCHGEAQGLGLRIEPPPTGLPQAQLAAWLEPREAEARRRWEDRAQLRARAEAGARPRTPPQGVALLGGDPALAAQLSGALEDSQTLRTLVPAMAAWKEALERPPQLLLIATPEDAEARHRLRTMLEAAPPACPMVILGRPEAPEEARAWATALRADATFTWNLSQQTFFRRLVQGLIRRHEGRIEA